MTGALAIVDVVGCEVDGCGADGCEVGKLL